MKKFFLSAWLIIVCINGYAQKPEEILNQWALHSPIEKAYLHFDRENYFAGETAWFKAYLYSGYQPDTISTNMYAELMNDSGKVMIRLALPVYFGTATGQFDLPDSLHKGNYRVRAYTPAMANFFPEFITEKPVFIYGKTGKNPGLVPSNGKTTLLFFPEGGNLISRVSNSIAFKAADKDGLPVFVNGKIVNEKDETIVKFSTYHDGMGMFDLTPFPGEEYNAVLDDDTTGTKYRLPQQTEKGIALSLIPHPQGSFFEIKQNATDPFFTAAYMIGQMQHQVVFKQEFKSSLNEIQGVINTKRLHPGILHVTIFNKDDQPLAERLCFVNNGDYFLKGELTADTLNFSARARNKFFLQLPDTIQGSFSVSVYDAGFGSGQAREHNILSGLLLSADIRGYVHNPAYYFYGDDDSVKTALDLLMMTHGWRRFKWTERSHLIKDPGKWKNPAYITLSGKVNLRDSKKPFADKQLLLMILGAHKKRNTQILQTDSEGRYFLDSLVFYDKSRLLFSDIRGKKSQFIDIYPGSDSLHRVYFLPLAASVVSKRIMETGNQKWQTDYDALQQAKGLMLQGVTVKTRKKSTDEEVNERYTTGLFSGDAGKTIDLVNNDEAMPYNNIFDYLQARVVGLQIAQDGFDYSLFYRQAPSASTMGNIPMILYLDEVETDASVIASIPASQVALVKLYPTFAAAAGNAPGGVLAIYSKKGSDYSGTSGFANLLTYEGYSVIKEFYAPDYNAGKQETKPDNRITLLWRPQILLNNINPRLPVSFYNNDQARQFKIVVEGMTNDGKLLMIEKTFGKK